MPYIAGIDPGANGAIAVYCTDSCRIVMMEDLPYWFQSVGKKKRKRIDTIGLSELFDMLEMIGVHLVVLEAVGGRPRQGASAGFTFGFSVGLIYATCMHRRIMLETVPPQRWKGLMRIPGKTKAGDDDILNRADEMFPHNRDMFRGKNGGRKIDRAEAAMLAKFGGDFILEGLGNKDPGDKAWLLAYSQADTGA